MDEAIVTVAAGIVPTTAELDGHSYRSSFRRDDPGVFCGERRGAVQVAEKGQLLALYALLGHDFSDFFQQGFRLVSGSCRQEIEGAIKRALEEALTLRIKDWARKWQLQG